MKTASFRTYTGPGRVSIARFAPRGCPAGYKIYKALAPGPWFNSVSKEEYLKRFCFEVLAPLKPIHVYDELHRLVGDGVEPVLLCWEVPPFTDSNWCHRRIVAEWFQRTLQKTVPELDPGAVKPTPSAPVVKLPEPQPATVTTILRDGEAIEVVGSKGAVYKVSNASGSLQCTCPASRFSRTRTCKHRAGFHAAP